MLVIPVLFLLPMAIVRDQKGASRFQALVKPLKQLFLVTNVENCVSAINQIVVIRWISHQGGVFNVELDPVLDIRTLVIPGETGNK